MIADQVKGLLAGTFFHGQVCHASDTHVYFVWYSVVMESCTKFSSGGDNNPDPCTERSQNPPVSSVDLGVNPRITFEKETGENLRAPSKAITVAKQSAHATEIPDVGPNHEQEERMRCPEKQPAFGSSCSLPESLECGFGEECCCGKCSPALVLFCLEGTWQGFNTDFCFRSGEESC